MINSGPGSNWPITGPNYDHTFQSNIGKLKLYLERRKVQFSYTIIQCTNRSDQSNEYQVLLRYNVTKFLVSDIYGFVIKDLFQRIMPFRDPKRLRFWSATRVIQNNKVIFLIIFTYRPRPLFSREPV